MNVYPEPWEVLYTGPNPDGTRKKCKNCVMFATKAKECYLFSPSKTIEPDMICGYHVYGEPMEEFTNRLPMEYLDEETSGLETVKSGTSCDNCQAYKKHDADDGKGECSAVHVGGKPATVEGRGCCTRWTAKVEKSGDMLQYFMDHPDKLEEKIERDKKKKLKFKIEKGRKLSRRMKFHGMDISIETDKGENRYWYDPHAEGEKGVTKMKYPYGYIRRTVGADDEHIDCYIGPEEDVDEVYIIHQMKKPDFKEYDEDKVMMGFESPKQAKAAYLMHYNDDKFFGSMDTMSVDEFKDQFVNKSLNPMTAIPAMMMVQSFDNPEYIDHLLKQVARMSDGQMMSLYKDMWGEGYSCPTADPDLIRDEIIGYLLDQRDTLSEQMMMQPNMQQSSLDLGSSPSSMDLQSEKEGQLEDQNSAEEDSTSMPSINSYFTASSTNLEKGQSESTE